MELVRNNLKHKFIIGRPEKCNTDEVLSEHIDFHQYFDLQNSC